MGFFRLIPAFLRFIFLAILLFQGERFRAGEAVRLPEGRPAPKSRKILGIGSEGESAAAEGAKRRVERMGEEACSKDDILVYQGATSPLPNGIPTYTVQILNTCPTGCALADIHVSCGWFSSARLINPRLFRRLRYDDCLVNNGAALASGESLSFQYANTYRYPLAVASVACS